MRLPIAPFVLAMAFAAPVANAQTAAGPPPAVGFIEATRRPVTESTEFVGRVEAINRVEIRARITGFLEQRLFTEGSEVPEGAPLFRIEQPPFQAQLDQARANVASAEASLANARVALTRARELRSSGTGTQVALDNATAQERTSAAQVLGAQAALRIAEINFAYTDITAPIAGAIGAATYTPGNVVSPSSQPLATIVSQDPMRVAFFISQRAGLDLRNRYESLGGASAVVVRIRRVDGSIYDHPGHIDFIDTSISRDTDTLLIRASIPNPIRAGAQANQPGSRSLIDNQFVTVLLESAHPVETIVLPRSAVAQDQQGFFVYIVSAENKAERRNVRLGTSTPDTATIESGLQVGDKVITEGIQRVRPGQLVDPAPANLPQPGVPAGRSG